MADRARNLVEEGLAVRHGGRDGAATGGARGPHEVGEGFDIRAVVLDKDNCFAIPHENEIFPANKAKFDELRQAYPGSKLLIVSNSSGTGADPGFKDAELLEKNTGVTVLRHSTKKPGCYGEIMDYFRSKPDSQVTKPEQVAIVGDRLFTDMMMANMMGAHSVWVRDGVVEDRNIVSASYG